MGTAPWDHRPDGYRQILASGSGTMDASFPCTGQNKRSTACEVNLSGAQHDCRYRAPNPVKIVFRVR